jgi:hypothetical protein
MLRRPALSAVCLILLLVVSGCGAPPNKEMDQAQGAIDAARAAGADRYAATEYSAATEALKNANEAVLVRDFRLALNHALESLEHAQTAARLGAETQAKVRADVERSTLAVTALLSTARASLSAAQAARVPDQELAQPAADIETAEIALQESDEAVAAGDYFAAAESLEGVSESLMATISMLDAMTARGAPQRR